MKKIFKYPVRDHQTIALPAGAKIISVLAQGSDVVVYAIVEEGVRGIEAYRFRIFGTGWELDSDLIDKFPQTAYKFLGTVQQFVTMPLVWHVFYRKL